MLDSSGTLPAALGGRCPRPKPSVRWADLRASPGGPPAREPASNFVRTLAAGGLHQTRIGIAEKRRIAHRCAAQHGSPLVLVPPRSHARAALGSVAMRWQDALRKGLHGRLAGRARRAFCLGCARSRSGDAAGRRALGGRDSRAPGGARRAGGASPAPRRARAAAGRQRAPGGCELGVLPPLPPPTQTPAWTAKAARATTRPAAGTAAARRRGASAIAGRSACTACALGRQAREEIAHARLAIRGRHLDPRRAPDVRARQAEVSSITIAQCPGHIRCSHALAPSATWRLRIGTVVPCAGASAAQSFRSTFTAFTVHRMAPARISTVLATLDFQARHSHLADLARFSSTQHSAAGICGGCSCRLAFAACGPEGVNIVAPLRPRSFAPFLLRRRCRHNRITTF